MSSWVIAVIGLAIVTGLILVARRWGKLSAERKILRKNIEAAKNRKAIDNETDKLDDDGLTSELDRFVRKS